MKILNVNHLYNILLTCVDMKIRNINIISQTTQGEIIFNERILKYNPNGFTPVHRDEAKFDPLLNIKQAQQLMSIFLQIQEQEEDLYTQMFYDEKEPETEKTRIKIRTNIGVYESKYYYNATLGYIELIFAISGIMVENLSDFDQEPILNEKKPRRRTLFPQRDLF